MICPANMNSRRFRTAMSARGEVRKRLATRQLCPIASSITERGSIKSESFVGLWRGGCDIAWNVRSAVHDTWLDSVRIGMARTWRPSYRDRMANGRSTVLVDHPLCRPGGARLNWPLIKFPPSHMSAATGLQRKFHGCGETGVPITEAVRRDTRRALDFTPEFGARIFRVELGEFAQKFFGAFVVRHWNVNGNLDDLVAAHTFACG